jgi:hypothetical protein
MSDQPSANRLRAANQPLVANSGTECETCGQPFRQAGSPATGTRFVYAVGRVVANFPSVGAERELLTMLDVSPGTGAIDLKSYRHVLSSPDNLYLARQLCWTFITRQADAFTLIPRVDDDTLTLFDMLGQDVEGEVAQVVVGITKAGPSNGVCEGVGLLTIEPIQLLAFTLDEFVDGLPRPQLPGEERGTAPLDGHQRSAIKEIFKRLTRRANNNGIIDEHRACNYAALRYPAIYHAVLQGQVDRKDLVGLDARRVPSSHRKVVAVRITHKMPGSGGFEHLQCLIDVTDVFPFIARPLEVVYD